MGSRDAGALQDLPWDRAVLASPHPPNLDTPLLVAPESPVWTLRFLLVRVHHRLVGAGQCVWVDEGGVVHLDKPLRLGVVNGLWGWQREFPGAGKRWGEVPPPPQKKMGVKMFELAQTNIFTPERKKGGGHPLAIRRPLLAGARLGGVDWVGKAWVWTPTWSALLDFEAVNRGAYAGLMHGIASRPKSKPKLAATPAGAPPQPHPRGVARWRRADAPRGGHRVQPDDGDKPQFGPRC